MRNIGSIDGLTRILGGIPLLVGAVLSLPDVHAQTLATTALWVALAVGVGALIGALMSHCSWYAGILITASAFSLLMTRAVPNALLQTAVASGGIIVGVTALFTRAVQHCPVNAALGIVPR